MGIIIVKQRSATTETNSNNDNQQVIVPTRSVYTVLNLIFVFPFEVFKYKGKTKRKL